VENGLTAFGRRSSKPDVGRRHDLAESRPSALDICHHRCNSINRLVIRVGRPSGSNAADPLERQAYRGLGVIIDLPTADSFKARSINLLNLAWEVTLSIQMHHDQAMEVAAEHNAESEGSVVWTEDDLKSQTETFWKRSQAELQNAQSLIHQAIELGLKGRICEVSPFLLIVRDARDYPAHSDKQDTPFARFRTIDAADLLRVANSVCATRLPDEFEPFWTTIREARNVNMHSIKDGDGLKPDGLIRNILLVNRYLFCTESWTKLRSTYLFAEHRDTAYKIWYYDFNISRSLKEIDTAIRLLTPAACLQFLKFRKKDRRYFCTVCDYHSNKYETGSLPHLAQLVSRKAGETQLYCCACDSSVTVRRNKCPQPDCKGNVLSTAPDSVGQCLTCQQFPD
jgi:hypothetical protein